MERIMTHMVDVAVTILIFFLYSCLRKGRLPLLQRLYVAASAFLLIWLLAIAGILGGADGSIGALTVLDAVTCSACALMVVTVLLLTVAFIYNYESLPRMFYFLYILPVATSVIVFTNPWHHLFYRQFSIYASEVKFGPLFILSGSQYYIYCILSIVLALRNGIRMRNKGAVWQSVLFAWGLIVPVGVNLLATLKIVDLSIAATPIAFVFTIICHGIAIYYFNFLNIKPIALQNIIDNISDGYVIISSESQIINMNDAFRDAFGESYGMKNNAYLDSQVEILDEQKRDVIYNLLSFFDICRQTVSVITYEQAVIKEERKIYYSVELTPVFGKRRMMGVVALFKDVTRVKEEIKQQQQKLSQEMERERLASLGQMIGGISHNLKTPIMSVSGSAESLERLVDEYTASLGDEEVTVEDHREIAEDMREWLGKIRESCAYMSDIITTVKGLATNMNTNNIVEFSVDEVFRRVFLLMKHSLAKNRCVLSMENKLPGDAVLKGDINNLVQVVNNLVENAMDAVKGEGGEITLCAKKQNGNILIAVKDSGPGIAPEVMDRLFHSMVTTKGAMGTGLGLYSSAGLIRGKFSGRMWAENRPEGGAAFYVELPLQS